MRNDVLKHEQLYLEKERKKLLASIRSIRIHGHTFMNRYDSGSMEFGPRRI
jgi:hypothetical protein